MFSSNTLIIQPPQSRQQRALYASGFHPSPAGHFMSSRPRGPRRRSSSAGGSASTPSPSSLLEALGAPPLSLLSAMSRSSLSNPGTHPRRLMPASALYLTAESVSRISSHRGSRAESDKWRAKRGKVGLGVDADVAKDVCGGRCERVGECDPCDGGRCTLSGRRRRGTGGGGDG
jgi:hypothetical protein